MLQRDRSVTEQTNGTTKRVLVLGKLLGLGTVASVGATHTGNGDVCGDFRVDKTVQLGVEPVDMDLLQLALEESLGNERHQLGSYKGQCRLLVLGEGVSGKATPGQSCLDVRVVSGRVLEQGLGYNLCGKLLGLLLLLHGRLLLSLGRDLPRRGVEAKVAAVEALVAHVRVFLHG